ncbi:MAG: acetate kinase, partial [Pseudomonadota bacterium]
MANSTILVLNAGSSSIKFAAFGAKLEPLTSGIAAEIGSTSFLMRDGKRRQMPFIDHQSALEAIIAELDEAGHGVKTLRAAAHRVVHGGRKLAAPVRITDDVLAEIQSCTPLAPLHNPHNLSAILSLRRLAPELPQFASFDTAFHATNPDVATRYAIPRMMETKGIRRYGFHGLSY